MIISTQNQNTVSNQNWKTFQGAFNGEICYVNFTEIQHVIKTLLRKS